MKRPISVAIDNDMVQVLDLLAISEERSRSQLIGRMLRDWLVRHPPLAVPSAGSNEPPEAA